ncbi:MAG TPA: SBBP repeat-containing protein, partial [Pyrinomonadaceae bacterium]|nr:SBBP repeat-containing protein [Pyrinomonadaceae bacterium]
MFTPSRRTFALTLSLVACLFVLTALLKSRFTARSNAPMISSATRAANEANELGLKAAYGKLPMAFEANRGQTDTTVKFLARGSGYSLFLTPNEAVLSLNTASRAANIDEDEGSGRQSMRLRAANEASGSVSSVLRMKMLGADPQAVVSGDGNLPGKSNYFIGQDPRQWRKDIPNFAKVKYQGIYKGINLTYYGNQRQLEYDFVIQPGSDPRQIALNFKGPDSISVDEAGDLVLNVAGREVRQQKPFAYQEVNGAKREINSRFALTSKNEIGFELGEYDATRPLVIDPVLVYSTYFGGTGADTATAITVNGAGEAFITGTTPSANFPGTALLGASTSNGDAYVAKLNAAGTVIVFASYFGGD